MRRLAVLFIILVGALLAPAGYALVSRAETGGATCYPVCSYAPDLIRAPKGFYADFLGLYYRAKRICDYVASHDGNSSSDPEFIQLLNRFNEARDILDSDLAKQRLGFAPSLIDWQNIGRFRLKSGKIARLDGCSGAG